MARFLRGYGREAGEPSAELATRGLSLDLMLWKHGDPASVNAHEHVGSSPRSLRVDWTLASAPYHTALVEHRERVLPLPRTWHELAHGARVASSLRRTGRGYRSVSRPQKI
jgi:hypothetical protein